MSTQTISQTPVQRQADVLAEQARIALADARRMLGDNATQNRVWPEAAKILRRRIEGEQELIDEIVDGALNKACWDAVKLQDSQLRGRIWVKSGKDDTGGLIRVAGTTLQGLMATPVRDGLLLGNATSDDLLPVAMELVAKGRTTMARGLWFQRIALALQQGVMVKKAFKHDDLLNLKAEAENEAGV